MINYTYTIGFIGCGNMGGALAKAVAKSDEKNTIAVCDFVEEKAKVVVNTRTEGVNPYVYLGEKETTVMFVNGTLENLDKTEFFVKGVAFNKVLSVDKDGVLREAAFEYDGGKVSVDRPLSYMSTVTLKLIKE